MNQVKIGEFLKELRKEKGLTQEDIAKEFNVTNRSVSRWENGYNLPDIDIIISLAEYYDVEISEILAGERKNDNTDQDADTAKMIVSISNDEKTRLLKVIHYITLGISLCFIICTIIGLLDLDTISPFKEIIDFLLGLSFGMALTISIYTSNSIIKIKNAKRRMLRKISN